MNTTGMPNLMFHAIGPPRTFSLPQFPLFLSYDSTMKTGLASKIQPPIFPSSD